MGKMAEQNDRFSDIFDLQNSLNKDIRAKRSLDNFTHEEWIQKHMLAMLSEMAEVLDEVNFKWWKNPKPVDSDALKEELVDVLHFYISMCIEAGMTPQELYDRYINKNKENFARQSGQSSKAGYNAADLVQKIDEQA
jgi:dimeric dUTPase (all-alpha-NTP-PPase superfamily)